MTLSRVRNGGVGGGAGACCLTCERTRGSLVDRECSLVDRECSLPRQGVMASLVRQKSVREREGAEAALAALRAEEAAEAALAAELDQTLFEIESLSVSAPPGGGKKSKKKKKKKKKKHKQAALPSHDDAAAALVHTRSQIAELARELSRGPGAPAAAAAAAPALDSPATALVHTRSQIAQLTRELSGAAGGGRTDNAQTEDEIIDAQLAALGKGVYQIRPDGDCLFSAISDQLRRIATDTTCQRWARGGPDALRSAAASVMRANADDYSPFLTEDLETYVRRIEGPTHEWGGQLELRALSDALCCTIVVHSAGEPPLRLEPEPLPPMSARGYGGQRQHLLQLQQPELHISYHLRQYMLGEHYNSVVPLSELYPAGVRGPTAGDDDGGGWTVA